MRSRFQDESLTIGRLPTRTDGTSRLGCTQAGMFHVSTLHLVVQDYCFVLSHFLLEGLGHANSEDGVAI